MFFLFGVSEVVYLLFFQGVLIKFTGKGGWIKMLSNLDTALLLQAGLLYGAIGALVGLLWWIGISQLAAGIRRLRKKDPKEARDFFALYLYVGLSLLCFLAFLSLLYFGRMPDTDASRLPFPLWMLIAGLICYGLFRAFYWVTDRLLSLPLIRILRHPVLHGVLATILFLLVAGLWVVPSVVVPAPEIVPAQKVYEPERSPPVILIVLDTCRADHFGSYGYSRPTTPNFDALARDGVLFLDAVSPSPWTLPSHASLFTGLYPRTHGATINHFQLDKHFFTLAEFLRACGYYTIGFSANTMVGGVTHLDQGFDRFEEVWRSHGRDRLALNKLLKKIGSQHIDKGAMEINRGVEHWLEERGSSPAPFFLFINYLETHGPYSPPPEFRDRFLSPEREGEPLRQLNIYDDRFVKYLVGEVDLTEQELHDLNDMYDGELAYVDMRLGELMEMLRRHDVLDEAVLIVLGDHGENLGEHRMTDHQLCVYDTLLEIPFLMRYPAGLPKDTEVRETVQLNSIFPTVVELLGVPTGQVPSEFSTQSLLPLILQDAPGLPMAFSEYRSPKEQLRIIEFKVQDFDVSVFDRDLISARTPLEKFIFASNGSDELYRLESDPDEENNLCEGGRCTADQPLRKAIEQWMARTPAYEPGEDAPSMSGQKDSEALEKLRSLGYIK